jgi:hypothetical protein
MKQVGRFFSLVLAALALSSGCSNGKIRQPVDSAPVAWAGVRASTYGVKPFPSVVEWEGFASEMEKDYPGSVGSFIWIVGNVTGKSGKRLCTVNFPLDKKVDGVRDFPMDENEAFLTMADEKGYAVWLQVEPGNADVVELAGAVMRRYAGHPSVRGFGVDVEWFQPGGPDGKKDTHGYGTAIGDELAERIEAAVNAVKKDYRVFLKHWDKNWMPPSYRGSLIFCNDSQGHKSLSAMQGEFVNWATWFYPNPVFFQIGYPADNEIWGGMENPRKGLGDAIAERLPKNQEKGIIWVDFTLNTVFGKGR